MGARRGLRFWLLATILLAVSTGCARAVSVGSGTNPVYPIEVRNDHDQDMIVSYSDGTNAPGVLGTVRANQTERFLIAAPARTAVTITAVNAAGTLRSGPYSITLGAGQTVTVVLRRSGRIPPSTRV